MLQDEISDWPPQELENILMQFSKNTLQPSYLKLNNTLMNAIHIVNKSVFEIRPAGVQGCYKA